MNSNKKYILWPLFGLAFWVMPVSCNDGLEEFTSSPATVVLDASILDTGTPNTIQTRSAYSGTTFANGRTMGLCVCKHESGTPSLFEPHQLGYGNIKVTCTNNSGNAWSFYNSATKATSSFLYLTTRKDSATADVYAYTPYLENLNDMNAIPVDFSKNQDLMWATQNGVGNLDLDPASNAQIPVTLQFQHVLSRIRVGFILENSGSNHVIDYITLKKTGAASTPIYSGGDFSVMTGALTNLVEAQSDSVKITLGGTDSRYENYGLFNSNTAYSYFDYLLYPTDYQADDDLTLVFSIDGFRHEYSIKKQDVCHSDNVTYGFKAGYSYDFQFLFDNYVHLKDITIKPDWTPGSMEDVL